MEESIELGIRKVENHFIQLLLWRLDRMFSIVRRLTTTVGHRLISFTQLGVNSTIVNQLAKQNITEATLIQEKVNWI